MSMHGIAEFAATAAENATVTGVCWVVKNRLVKMQNKSVQPKNERLTWPFATSGKGAATSASGTH